MTVGLYSQEHSLLKSYLVTSAFGAVTWPRACERKWQSQLSSLETLVLFVTIRAEAAFCYLRTITVKGAGGNLRPSFLLGITGNTHTRQSMHTMGGSAPRSNPRDNTQLFACDGKIEDSTQPSHPRPLRFRLAIAIIRSPASEDKRCLDPFGYCNSSVFRKP
jgi:hypothetical protein